MKLATVAPLVDGVALLGEIGKLLAVSAHRVARVATPVADGGETRALPRGAPGENVSVAFAVAQSGGEPLRDRERDHRRRRHGDGRVAARRARDRRELRSGAHGFGVWGCFSHPLS